MPQRYSARGALNLPGPPGRPGHPQVGPQDFDSRPKKGTFTSTSITLSQRDAAPCGKLIRLGQSRAVPTMSVAPHQAPWRLPLFFLFYSQWQVAWVYKVTAMLWIWGCSLQGGSVKVIMGQSGPDANGHTATQARLPYIKSILKRTREKESKRQEKSNKETDGHREKSARRFQPNACVK